MAASDGELKVFKALGRTCAEPWAEKAGTGPRTSKSTASKCPGLAPRVRAKAFLVNEATKGLMVELSSQHPSSLKMKASWGQGQGRTRKAVISAQVHLPVQEGGHRGQGSGRAATHGHPIGQGVSSQDDEWGAHQPTLHLLNSHCGSPGRGPCEPQLSGRTFFFL